MEPLLSMEDSQELDRETRTRFQFSSDQLMEIASLRLWEKIRHSLEAYASAIATNPKQLSLTAMCGKGDNAGDALAILRHARMDGYNALHAIIPPPETLKDNARINYHRALQAGVTFHVWKDDHLSELGNFIASQDVILDAILGTGVRGPATGVAANMIKLLNAVSEKRCLSSTWPLKPRVFSIDIPSGLGDAWNIEYPCVRADTTFCICPLKEALFMPDARQYVGVITPVRGVFMTEHGAAHARAFLAESDLLPSLLPPVLPWAHKMQRGRVAILAGSTQGAGAAVHCVRGAAAAGAGYIALFCDHEIFSPMLAAIGDQAIVRVNSAAKFNPEEWDVVIAGPGWGRNAEKSRQIEMLLNSKAALVLDADGIRMCAALREEAAHNTSQEHAHPAAEASLILLPHPGEMKDLLRSIQEPATINQAMDQVLTVSRQFGAVVALRAVTTHVANPDGKCFVHDGYTPGLGIAGSGDVLAGIVGGLLARWIAFRALQKSQDMPPRARMAQDSFNAACAAVLAHARAGRELFHERGWFNPAVLAERCSMLLADPGECNAAP